MLHLHCSGTKSSLPRDVALPKVAVHEQERTREKAVSNHKIAVQPSNLGQRNLHRSKRWGVSEGRVVFMNHASAVQQCEKTSMSQQA